MNSRIELEKHTKLVVMSDEQHFVIQCDATHTYLDCMYACLFLRLYAYECVNEENSAHKKSDLCKAKTKCVPMKEALIYRFSLLCQNIWMYDVVYYIYHVCKEMSLFFAQEHDFF